MMNEPPSTRPEGAGLDRLWTPWRSAYVGVPQPPGCFLCNLQAAGPEEDRPNLVLYRDSNTYLLLNRFPYNSGHLLAAPRAHQGDFVGLSPGLRDELFALAQRAAAVLAEVYRPGGFNVGLNLGSVAGAGVPDHLHVHVVPRWLTDSNFMTAVSETRVLPESLEQTFDRLRPYFE